MSCQYNTLAFDQLDAFLTGDLSLKLDVYYIKTKAKITTKSSNILIFKVVVLPPRGCLGTILSGRCLKVSKWLCVCYRRSVGSGRDQRWEEQFHIMLDVPTNHSCRLKKKNKKLVCNYLSQEPSSVLHKNTDMHSFNIHWIFQNVRPM